MASFPHYRLQRLRRTPALRGLRCETRLHREQLIDPLFVVEDSSMAGAVPSMPGIERFTLDSLDRRAEAVGKAGIQAILLFGVPARKDAQASGSFAPDGIVCRAVERIKRVAPDLVVITDVCLCPYTDHGHCGLLATPRADSRPIDNDATLEVLGRVAVAHARAGADLVAPSGMIDGMVSAIRLALDNVGLVNAGILSYSAKYASAFYGPFRDAADSAPHFGDRRAYQMDPANAREALAEVALDIDEGADMVMVKPALPCLDIIRRVRDTYASFPLAAYQVSGEYSMIKAAAQNGWLDERRAMMETLTAIVRAGADVVITYFALAAAEAMESKP